MLRSDGPLRTIVRDAQHVRVEPWVWRAIHYAGVGVPVVLALSAARGYYWTALQLAGTYHLTLVFSFLLFAALHLALRWVLLARRRPASRQWRGESEAELAQLTKSSETGERQVIPEPGIGLGEVDAQTCRLLYTSAVVALLVGLWVLWADLVPALGVLND